MTGLSYASVSVLILGLTGIYGRATIKSGSLLLKFVNTR